MSNLADLRVDYHLAALSEQDLAVDPFQQFERWFREAEAARVPEPNAMVLATVGPDGRPAARTVLLKNIDERGFVFYTQLASRKGRELERNPQAALVFLWLTLARQVIIEGRVTRVSREEAEAYFRVRPRESQMAAWASPQSSPVASRTVLEHALAAAERKFAGREVPMPPGWGGYRLEPSAVEFWQGRPGRLHDRLRFRRGAGGAWAVERLAP